MIQLMEGGGLTTLHIVTGWMIVCAVYKPQMMARDSGGRKSPFQGPGSRTSIDPHFDLSQPVVRWGIGRREPLHPASREFASVDRNEANNESKILINPRVN